MAIYMKLDGADGEVTEQSHKNWIELTGCSWNMTREVRSAVGIAANRESKSVRVSEITIEKFVDKASKGTANLAFNGQAKKVQIDFTRTDSGQEAIFRTLELENAIVTGLSNEASGSERPIEVLTLNFTKITISDISQKADGSTDNTARVSYDLATTKAS